MPFINMLYNLWPHGDDKVPGIRDCIANSAQAVFSKYGINSPLLIAHVMAQISHECDAGLEVVESLNYSASRMTEVWPSRFRSVASAAPFAHNPKALANKVYDGRMGNRPDTDDGWNFRGRGGSQTTGREGYERVKKQTGFDVVNDPDILIDPKYFLEFAVSDFINCGCLPYAKADDVENVTKKLNGGLTNLADRQQWLKRWKAALGTGPIILAPASPAKAPAVILPSTPNPLPPDVPRPDPVPQVTPATQPALAKFIAALATAFRRK